MSKILMIILLFQSPSLLYSQDEWKPIFNGKDFNGWSQVGDGKFEIEDGNLKTQGGMGLLWYTPQKLKNVVIKIEYKNPGGKNAGIFIRIPEKPEDAWMPVNKGYEVQIDDNQDDFHVTGVLYSLTGAKAKPSKPGEWNTMEITLDETRTMVMVNGVLVTDFKEGDKVPPKKEDYEPDRGPRPIEGYIGLQNHGDEDIVYFRKISIKSIKK